MFRDKILDWCARYLLRQMLGVYEMPFTRVEEWYNGLPEYEKAQYIRSARELMENECFKREMEEATRRFYSDLALKTENQTAMVAYRLTLVFIQQLHGRVKRMSTANLEKPRHDVLDKV